MLMALFPQVSLYLVLIFVNGVTFINKVFISYAHFVENLGSKQASRFTGWLFFFDGSISIWSPLILMYVTRDATLFVYGSLALCLALLILLKT